MQTSNPIRWRRAQLALLVIWSMVTSTAGQQPASAPPPLVKENATVKVSDHVYVIPDGNVPAVPNVGIIVGNRATLVVDTGLGPRNGQTILREVDKVSRNTELYVVTTHFHPEHLAGGAGFPASAKFIRPNAQQKDVEEFGRETLATFSSRTPFMAELLKDVDNRPADILFDRDYQLDLGGIRVRMFWLGPMHTRGDTLIFVEGDRVLFAGDVIMNKAFLAFASPYASAQTWLATLDQLEPLRPSTIVPSHGAMGDASLIDKDRGFLKALQARVRELKSLGKSSDETAQIAGAEIQAKYPDWTAPNRIAVAARTIYAELP